MLILSEFALIDIFLMTKVINIHHRTSELHKTELHKKKNKLSFILPLEDNYCKRSDVYSPGLSLCMCVCEFTS